MAGNVLLVAALLACGAPAMAAADEPQGEARDGWSSGVTGALNLVVEDGLFWDLPAGAAPSARYDGSRQWLEGSLAPWGGYASRHGDWRWEAQGSIVATATAGSDAFAAADTGRIGVEEAWVSLAHGDGAQRPRFTLVLGAQPLRLAGGMLIANGGSNGFERGALKLGPRKAWRDAARVGLSHGAVEALAFRLSPNEQPSNTTGTLIHGVDLAWRAGDGPADAHGAGLTWLEVDGSRAPYPQAAPDGLGAPTIIEGGRGGLRAAHLWGAWRRALGGERDVFARLDLAREGHRRLDLEAWAARVQAGTRWTGEAGTWGATWSWQGFSGDDPSTPRLERFDPLYYEGSPSSWATGSKSAMLFINSNVAAHQLALSLERPGARQLTLRVARVEAMRLRSPLQFGQATRLDDASGGSTLVSGVTRRHLTDDLYLEYSRPVGAGAFVSIGASVSLPGAGIRAVFPTTEPNWSGAYVTFVLVR